MVSIESVNTILLISDLNDLDVQYTDIHNACLNAENREKFWMRTDPEFLELKGKNFIIKKALYVLKSAGPSFRSFVASNLDEIGFTSCVAGPYFCRLTEFKHEGEEYYEYVVIYVDDIISVSIDEVGILEDI